MKQKADVDQFESLQGGLMWKGLRTAVCRSSKVHGVFGICKADSWYFCCNPEASFREQKNNTALSFISLKPVH